MRRSSMVLFLWTLLSLASAYFILGDVLGGAAWNGVNFVVGVYILFSVGGFLGLLAGFGAAFSEKRLFAWVTCLSAAAVAVLSAIFAYGFLFHRTQGVPLNSPLIVGRFHVPIILLYSISLVCCSIEALLYFPKAKKLIAI